jgi:hypothetical protein
LIILIAHYPRECELAVSAVNDVLFVVSVDHWYDGRGDPDLAEEQGLGLGTVSALWLHCQRHRPCRRRGSSP